MKRTTAFFIAGVLLHLTSNASWASDELRVDPYGVLTAHAAPEIRGPYGGIVEALGRSNADMFYDAVATSDGGVVAVGYTMELGAAGEDILLVKFDRCGDIIWATRLAGDDDEVGRSVIEVSGGDLVITGRTTSIGGEGDHLLISRFDADGSELWTTVVTDPTGSGDYLQLRGYDVIEDSTGDFVVTGTVWTTVTKLYSVLLAKFAPDGSLLAKAGFRRPLSSSWDYWGESIIDGCSGNYIVAGGTLVPGLVPENDDRRILVARFTPAFAFGWARVIQGEGGEPGVGHSVTLADDGDLVLTGMTDDHLFISKRNCTGLPLPDWQQRLQNQTEGHHIIQTSGPHDLVVTGRYSDDSVFVRSWTSNGTASWLRWWGDGIG